MVFLSSTARHAAHILSIVRNPRVGCLTVIVMVCCVFATLPVFQAIAAAGCVLAAYVTVELHVAGTLAPALVAAVHFVFTKTILVLIGLATLVTVVISFIITRLPQVTSSELAKASAIAKAGGNIEDAFQPSFAAMAMAFVPKVAQATLGYFVPGAAPVMAILAEN